MKKFIIIIVSVFFYTCVIAQTKPKATLDETVNWIIEKLNTYSKIYVLKSGELSSSNQDYSFFYDKGQQIIKVNYSIVASGPNLYEKRNLSSQIALSSISKIEYKTNYVNVNKNEGDGKNEYFLLTTYTKAIKSFDKEKQATDFYNTFLLPIDFNQEDDLQRRLQKAFSDLISHFPKKQEAY